MVMGQKESYYVFIYKVGIVIFCFFLEVIVRFIRNFVIEEGFCKLLSGM